MSQGEPVIDVARAAQILGVEGDCTPDALRTAFRAAVKRAHPDRPGGDPVRLRAVIEAYECLQAWRGRASPAGRRPAAPILEITPLEALIGARRPVTQPDASLRHARLPPGLRAGDRVRLGGQVMTVAITSDGDLAVIGDHLCISLTVETAVMRQGGLVEAQTPFGPRQVRITRQEALRGLARVIGAGLPARGKRPAGDLLVRLREASAPDAFETPAQVKLRRFTADWAA